MKLKELKSCIDQCVKSAKKLDPNVEVLLNNDPDIYEIERVGQFGVVPDVTITIKRKKINFQGFNERR